MRYFRSTGCVFSSRSYVGSAEPPATVLEDESRYGSDGDFKSDGHPDWVQLPSGLWALDFDSSAPDYVEIPADQTQLDFTSEDFSIIIRLRLDTLTSDKHILCRGLSVTDGYYWHINAAGGAYFTTSQSTANQATSSAAGTIVAATWYTLGFSRDGAAVKLFKNGVDITSVSGTHINPTTCSRSVKVGIYDDKTSNPWDGKIEFLQIYNYALSADQHAQKHTMLKDWV